MILIQGAMDIEIQYLLDNLKETKKHIINEFVFYKGKMNGSDIILSKTEIGTINATLATTIGIINFKPDIVINQGIAGAHLESIHTGNMILGETCVNINALKMPAKQKGEGSNPFEWEANDRGKEVYFCDDYLLKIAENTKYQIGKKYIGRLGSGDIFNREVDRIHWIQGKYDNLCEDMESIGVYQTCQHFHIPCIGIRVISNNEITKEPLNEDMAIECQKFVLKMIEHIT